MTFNNDPYITTYTGGKFYYFLSERSVITIEDIAHALSNTCRFGGHVREFYSVAQHSLMVSELLGGNDEFSLHGLMHDAAEAFCCDLPSPCKVRCNGEYSVMEREVMDAIYWLLEIPKPSQAMIDLVKKADQIALVTEAKSLLKDSRWTEEFPFQPLDRMVRGLSPTDAKTKFLIRYDSLRGAYTDVTYKDRNGVERFRPGQSNTIRLPIPT